MKKNIKLFLSLILMLTSIPILQINTASAQFLKSLELAEVKLDAGEEKELATCFIKGDLVNFSSSVEPLAYLTVNLNDGFAMLTGFSYANDIKCSDGCKTILSILNNGTKSNTFKSNFVISNNNDSSSCYYCTLFNKGDEFFNKGGYCVPQQTSSSLTSSSLTSGVSRILAPLSTLFGRLLLLF